MCIFAVHTVGNCDSSMNQRSYKIGEVADMLGVHEDTLRNWDDQGLVVADRFGTRRDRRYTAEHIKQIRDLGLVSTLARKGVKRRDYSKYTKEQLIKELHSLREQKKFGLVWEDRLEEVVERCKTQAPILKPVSAMNVNGKKDEQRHIMIEGDNYHALEVLNYTHKEKIDVIYIDPPYNTGAKNWKYNNNYVEREDAFRHSKWLSMMNRRLILAKNLLKNDGVLICAIDENEHANLILLLRNIFPQNKIDSITVVHNPRGVQGKNFSYTHEYAVFVYPGDGGKYITDAKREETLNRNFRVDGSNSPRKTAKTCFYPFLVRNKKIIGVGDVADDNFHPKKQTESREGVVYVWPIDVNGVERKWSFSRGTVEEIFDQLEVREHKKDRLEIYRLKDYAPYRTVWSGSRYDANEYGSKLVNGIIDVVFPFPKSLYTVYDCVFAVARNRLNAIVLDFFAGSGTTGHAVMDLNKEDGGNRQFILCTNNENNDGDKGDESKGIARGACQPRIRGVMGGYKKKGGGEKVEGLGGNLEYLKTEFVDVDNVSNVSDKKKLEFTHEAGWTIALKENAFTEVEKNDWYQIFTDGENKFVGVYFREDLEKIEDFEKEILDKPEVKMYLFSYGGNDDWRNDYEEYENVSVESIPEPILRVYKSLNW